jgi:primosomal protein N' (replication factor Y)
LSEKPASPDPAESLARIAVPLPLAEPLSYSLPERLRGSVAVGARVRVSVGRRRLIGVVVGLGGPSPPGVTLRDVDELLDGEALLPPDLLELAEFVSSYYLAPIGEVLRTMAPSRLPPWGAARVRITRAGTFATGATALEREVLDTLLESGESSLAELRRSLPVDAAAATVQGLLEKGWIAARDTARSGSRYRSAVELPAGDLEAQLVACGRSPQGRAVVKHLAQLERPASIRELATAVGCTPAVVRRLVGLGILRSFTEMTRLDLGRHLVAARAEADDIVLTTEQEKAVAALAESIDERSFRSFLLRGVTGSGKSEIYLRSVERVLERGRSAILLVPEISLVPVLATEARRRFGDELAILHSALGEAERAQEWQRVRSGAARVVLGPRSAVFAPVSRLGLIVVDEEHDPSFKQEHVPRYNARDLALVRAKSAGAAALLVSATPSLESRHNVETGKLGGLVLSRRVAGGNLPEGVLVDLRKEGASERLPGEVAFSRRLRAEMEDSLEAGEQIILLRNRRGYAPVLLCRACGEKLPCEDCGLPRTYHRRDRRLVCHYCGSSRPEPAACESCGEAALEPIGAGTERVEERVRELYPGVAVDVLDRDAARRVGGAAAVLERFGSGATRILVGTQMVSKGHHFPDVGLAAVLSADSYLSFPDFRAVERTYSLLTQLAGRAGRGERPGRVVIQTYYPRHYAIRAALAHDDEAFLAEEMRFRRVFHYPPFTRLVQILFKGKNREQTRDRIEEYARDLGRHGIARETRISGPAPAPLERLKGEWRFQMLLRHPSGGRLRRLVEQTLPSDRRSGIVIDVDPQDLF